MAIFGPKPWVNPFGKMSIFRLFQLLVFTAQKGVFRSRISQKIFSRPILPKKKKLEKCPFLDRKHWLTPFKNLNFLTFSFSSFYRLERRFLVLEYRKRYFSGLYCLKKKVAKIAIFGPKPFLDQNHWPFLDQNQRLWKNVNFSTFSTSCF